jgi:inosose dehydratase
MMNAYPERIGYLHLKQVHPDILADTLKNDLPFVEAVAKGVMTEPGGVGVPEFAPILELAAKIDADMFAIVEQDMYGCDVDFPGPIAKRTRDHIASCTYAARFI